MKIYRCKFCNKVSGRKTIRKCIMTHIKTDKYPGRLNSKESHKNSNITAAMLREDK